MRRTLAVLSSVTILMLIVASTAVARQSYCSPSGDYCTSATLDHGKRTRRVGTFANLASRIFGGCANARSGLRGRSGDCISRSRP